MQQKTDVFVKFIIKWSTFADMRYEKCFGKGCRKNITKSGPFSKPKTGLKKCKLWVQLCEPESMSHFTKHLVMRFVAQWCPYWTGCATYCLLFNVHVVYLEFLLELVGGLSLFDAVWQLGQWYGGPDGCLTQLCVTVQYGIGCTWMNTL